MNEIEQILRKLGIYSTLKGFSLLAYGVYLVMQDNEYLQNMTKRLYPDIAEHFNTKPSRVERNIRNVVLLIWERGNREYLNEIAGYNMIYKPTCGELIDIIVAHIFKLHSNAC